MHRLAILIGLVLATCGCAARPPADVQRIVIVVPGAGGHGPGTQALIRGLKQASPDAHYKVFHWGMPAPLFMLNLQNDSIHRDAEQKLSQFIAQQATLSSSPRIDVVGHSAGCGVALGAIAMLNKTNVNTLILLSPSVSPGYDLLPAMSHVSGETHVFISDRDTLWLSWRCRKFGTYDDIKTQAAGHVGFDNPPAGITQHAYLPEWNSLGNDGGHFGTLSYRFADSILSQIFDDRGAKSLANRNDPASPNNPVTLQSHRLQE